jgi:glyoxylase-like metal-dependent hydrolase (beta-lactamase superfamily II)
MNCTRREFSEFSLTVGLMALSGLVRAAVGAPSGLIPGVGWRRPDGSTYLDWKPIGKGAWAGFGEGGNSLVVAGGADVLVVDTKNAPFGSVLLREAAGLGGSEKVTVNMVVNTHHHADHTGGNAAFTGTAPVIAQRQAGARILGQLERYKAQIKSGVGVLAKSEKPGAKAILDEAAGLVEKLDSLRAEDWAPTEFFDKDRELKVGTERVVLRHIGPGHTDNDVFVHLPERNLIHAGDLLVNNLHPVMDRAGGATTTGWMDSVRTIIELCDEKTVVVPGHGELSDIGGLRKQVTYFQILREAMAKVIGEGKSVEEAKALEIDEFKGYGMQQMRARTFAAVYEEISGSLNK